MSEISSREKIFESLRSLTHQPGFIYALMMIVIEDFNVAVEEIHKTNTRERLSHKELALLFGFLVQKEIDFSIPRTYLVTINQKKEAYRLLTELHSSWGASFANAIMPSGSPNLNEDFYSVLADGDFLLEPIFYSGTGVFDFQYLEYLPKKYKYDSEWLKDNKGFEFESIIEFANLIKNQLQVNTSKILLLGIKENFDSLLESYKAKYPHIDLSDEEKISQFREFLEIQQYLNLFAIEKVNPFTEPTDHQWNKFYENLLKIFLINSEIVPDEKKESFERFLENFTINPSTERNVNFNSIGSFNEFSAAPIIKTQQGVIVPLAFYLFEAIYESPYYWMTQDKKYAPKLSENRGRSSEEIVYGLLVEVFGESDTFASVLIKESKAKVTTDVDVLCVLGNKALIVQIKSKKLTQLSKMGDTTSLEKDFQQAIQDAYGQGKDSRKAILGEGYEFFDKNGEPLQFSDEINEVFILVVTTENYTAITHQANILLKKEESDPYPLVLTVFDLEVLLHYLSDPYNFMYYVRQRISTMKYFIADEETVYLGFHLNLKLWKNDRYSFVPIDVSFGQLIERNFYPFKMGLSVSKEGDNLKAKWFSENYNHILKKLKKLRSPIITDVIFNLLDLSESAGNLLAENIFLVKSKTLRDNKDHDVSTRPDFRGREFGMSYFSCANTSSADLAKRLRVHCEMKKYESKVDGWIGLGSSSIHSDLIDTLYFTNSPWCEDREMERKVMSYKKVKRVGQYKRAGNKLGRNDICFCGSGMKYKKCCLEN